MNTRRDGLLIFCCTAVLLSWFYGRTLLEEREYLFRDSLYYYELFKYVHEEFEAGRFPLWNPYDNSGTPLAANPTACVFYPGKFLFQLPFSFQTNFTLFIALHHLLAVVSMYCLSRALSLSSLASGLAGLCYAASGSVAFQHTNLVFLIGAAWLPFGLMFGLRLIERPNWKSSLGLSIVLALMVVGGDPQTGYHLGMILGLAVLMKVRISGEQHEPPETSEATAEPAPQHVADDSSWIVQHCKAFLQNQPLSRLWALAKAACVAALLATVQIWLTSDFTAVSVRSMSEVPENIWEVPEHLIANRPLVPRIDTGKEPHWYDTLIGDPPMPAKHYLQRYHFSLEPYRLIELLFPHFSGPLQPEEVRWTRKAGWESINLWQPTIFMGVIPILLAFVALRQARSSRLVRWMTLVAIVSLLASFGRYGFLWLIHAFPALLGQDYQPSFTGSEVGGLYWFFVVLLPKYASFRFPAKWLVITSLAIALLAAKGFDRTADWKLDSKSINRLWSLCGITAVIWLINLLAIPALPSTVGESKLYATAAIIGGMTLCCTLIAAVYFLLKPIDASSENSGSALSPYVSIVLLGLCTLELAYFNGQIIVSYPAGEMERRLWLEELYETKLVEKDREQAYPPRIHVPFRLIPFSDNLFQASTNRATTALSTGHMRDVLSRTSNMTRKVPLTFVYGTMVYNSYETMYDLLPIPQLNVVLNPRRSFDAWSTEYFVLPKSNMYDSQDMSTLGLKKQWQINDQNDPLEKLIPIGEPLPEIKMDEGLDIYPEIMIVKNSSAYDRCWFVKEAKYVENMGEKERIKWMRIQEQMVYPMVAPIDLKSTAVIEYTPFEIIEPTRPLNQTADPFYVPEKEYCRIVKYEPNRIELEVSTVDDRWLILSEAYDKGWQARLEIPEAPELNKPIKIYKANRSMRGLFLGAGKCRIVMEYRPAGFSAGVTISILTIVAVLIASIYYAIRDRRRRLA